MQKKRPPPAARPAATRHANRNNTSSRPAGRSRQPPQVVKEIQYVPFMVPAQPNQQLGSNPQETATFGANLAHRGAVHLQPLTQPDPVHPLYDKRERMGSGPNYDSEYGVDFTMEQRSTQLPGMRGLAPGLASDDAFEDSAAYEPSREVSGARRSLASLRRPALRQHVMSEDAFGSLASLRRPAPRQNVMPEDALGYVVCLFCSLVTGSDQCNAGTCHGGGPCLWGVLFCSLTIVSE
jgi:hypothetical protein